MNLGFIGLGVQGLPLARNMIEAGHKLYGFDVRSEPQVAIRDAGGVVASSVGEVASASEIIFICVATDDQLLDVVTGEGGVATRAAAGTTIVSHCTVSAETISTLRERCEQSGLSLVDAPVSGGAGGAKDRTMSFMVGCEDAAFALCEPLFRLSGPTILRTGGVGTATFAKLAHQVTVIGNILAMAEGMRLGVASGLDPLLVKQVITGGFAQSRVADTWGEIKMAPHAIPIYTKDLENSLALAAKLGITLPGAEVMKQQIAVITP